MSVVTATELEARHAALAADCLSKGKASQSSLTRQEALSPIVRYIPTTKTVERMQRRQLAAAQKALERAGARWSAWRRVGASRIAPLSF